MTDSTPPSTQARPDDAIGLLGIAWRGRYLIVLLGVLAAAGAYAGSKLSAPVYQAEAAVLVKLGREFLYTPEVGVDRPASMYRLEEMINTEIEILESRELIAEVLEEIGVEALYPDIVLEHPENAFDRGCAAFRANLDVQGVPDSSVIKVGFEHGEPAMAAQTANALIGRFVAKHLEIFSDDRSVFLEAMTTEHTKALAEAEDAMAAFAEETGIVDIDRQRGVLLDQRSRLENSVRDVEVRLTELSRRIGPAVAERGTGLLASSSDGTAVLEGNLPLSERLATVAERVEELRRHLHEGLPPGPEPVPGELASSFRTVGAAEARLLTLELERREILANFGPNDRQLQTLDEQIATIRRFIVDGLLDELESLWTREATVRDQMTRVDARLRLFADAERRYRDLVRRRSVAEHRYEESLASWQDARIADQLDAEGLVSVRVIDRAHPPIEPAGLSLKMRVALAAMVGMGAGALLTAYRYR